MTTDDNQKSKNEQWSPGKATQEINGIARSDALILSYKRHAIDRFQERGLIVSDLLYVLKNGFVYEEPEPSTRNGYNKYKIESRCPNGGNRSVRVIVIPDKATCELKLVTVMWADEN